MMRSEDAVAALTPANNSYPSVKDMVFLNFLKNHAVSTTAKCQYQKRSFKNCGVHSFSTSQREAVPLIYNLEKKKKDKSRDILKWTKPGPVETTFTNIRNIFIPRNGGDALRLQRCKRCPVVVLRLPCRKPGIVEESRACPECTNWYEERSMHISLSEETMVVVCFLCLFVFF